MSKSNAGKCPNCGKMVEIGPFSEAGDEAYCDSCDSELEIANTQPLRFKILSRQDYYDEYEDIEEYNEDEEL